MRLTGRSGNRSHEAVPAASHRYAIHCAVLWRVVGSAGVSLMRAFERQLSSSTQCQRDQIPIDACDSVEFSWRCSCQEAWLCGRLDRDFRELIADTPGELVPRAWCVGELLDLAPEARGQRDVFLREHSQRRGNRELRFSESVVSIDDFNLALASPST
jgi:hypothetical protein